jgi:RND family efflux transporter MFP subunit
MMQKIVVSVILSVGVLAGGVWWYMHGNKLQGGSENSVTSQDEASVLIKTQLVAQQNLPISLTVFGDVATGKVVALGFPQAGQITQLSAVVGQLVHKGYLLATITSDPNAQTAYAQATSAAHFARSELQRNLELFALQLATQSQLDAARKALQDAEANLESQKKLGGEASAASIFAPFDGVVTALAAGQGDRVQAGATILQVGHTGTLRVQFGIEPAQSHLVRAGMPVTFFAVQDPAKTIAAKITELQNIVDPKTQLVNALVELPLGAAPNLVAGMRTQGVIQVGQRQAWSVPRQAVLSDDKGSYIFQIAQGKASRVEVEKLIESEGAFGVTGKLDPKLPVVVLGNYELQEGMPVREGAR